MVPTLVGAVNTFMSTKNLTATQKQELLSQVPAVYDELVRSVAHLSLQLTLYPGIESLWPLFSPRGRAIFRSNLRVAREQLDTVQKLIDSYEEENEHKQKKNE